MRFQKKLYLRMYVCTDPPIILTFRCVVTINSNECCFGGMGSGRRRGHSSFPYMYKCCLLFVVSVTNAFSRDEGVLASSPTSAPGGPKD